MKTYAKLHSIWDGRLLITFLILSGFCLRECFAQTPGIQTFKCDLCHTIIYVPTNVYHCPKQGVSFTITYQVGDQPVIFNATAPTTPLTQCQLNANGIPIAAPQNQEYWYTSQSAPSASGLSETDTIFIETTVQNFNNKATERYMIYAGSPKNQGPPITIRVSFNTPCGQVSNPDPIGNQTIEVGNENPDYNQ